MANESKKEWMRVVKFTLFSISAGVIQIGSYALFHDVFGWAEQEWLCHLLSLTLSVLWNFTFNRKFTFQSAANVPIAMIKVALFYVVFAPLSTWWTHALTGGNFGFFSLDYVVEIGTMLVNFVTEFLYQRFFVFKNSIDTAKQ